MVVAGKKMEPVDAKLDLLLGTIKNIEVRRYFAAIGALISGIREREFSLTQTDIERIQTKIRLSQKRFENVSVGECDPLLALRVMFWDAHSEVLALSRYQFNAKLSKRLRVVETLVRNLEKNVDRIKLEPLTTTF